jgi:flagellar protein FliS
VERVVTLENVEMNDLHGRPELITSLLYKKLLQKIEEAQGAIAERKYAQANDALQFCCDIVERLGFGIKYEAGVLADRLEMLYQYVFDLLVKGNMQKDSSALEEVRNIIKVLDEAWTIAMKKEKQLRSPGGKPGVRKPSMNPYERLEIENETLDKAQASQRNL